MSYLDRWETSLTKGTFAHKPQKLKKKFAKPRSSVKHAQRQFKKLWSEMEAKIQDIEASSYQKTFEALLKFVQRCIKFPLDPMDEIPAAVLQMGVNMPDHCNIFKHLEQLLRLNDNYTVILESRKCCNFSSTLQIIDQELQKQVNKVTSSPRKRTHVNSQKNLKRIIFLIQDVETFNVELLEDIILNCKIYLKKLPIVLVFGMSSAMVTLHNILPQRALCHLGIETFHSFAATEYLTRIIEELVMSPEYPFKLGPKVFRLIVDTVLYHDFSVTNLSHLLRFSLMEHFYNRKYAILCCPESEIEKNVSDLKNEELMSLKKLPSLNLYNENNPDSISNLSSPPAFRSLLLKLVKNLFAFQNSVIVCLRVLYHLTKDLPGSPLGKQFREVYYLNLEKQIYLTKGFKEAEKLLKLQSQKELLLKFEACLSLLESCDASRDLLEILQHSIEQLTQLTSEDFEKKIPDNLFNPGNEKFSSRFELQEKMRSSIQLKRSKFEAVRNEAVDNILAYFKGVHSPLLLPLHEIFFFDDVSALKKHLMPSPRVTFCCALSNPNPYFQCKCCKISELEEIQTCMPDVCILYKLHLECGKLINLCDWLEAFKTYKNQEMETKPKKNTSTAKLDDSKINIRFLHAASELQLLGFIKPTQRKTDHVARLTFGTF